MHSRILAAFLPARNVQPVRSFLDRCLSNLRHLRSLGRGEQSAVLQHWNDILMLWSFHSGLPEPPASDQFWALLAPRLPQDTESTLDAALDRLARRFASEWRIFAENVGLQRALREEGEASERTRDEVKREVMRAGLILALAEAAKPQRIRIGERWVHEIDGRPVVFTSEREFRDMNTGESGPWNRAARPAVALSPPISLPFPYFEQWLRHQTIEAAEASLLDRPYPLSAADVLDQVDGDPGPGLAADQPDEDEDQPDEDEEGRQRGWLAAQQETLLDDLIAAQEQPADRWEERLRTLTPDQRQILEQLCNLRRHGLTMPDAKEIAAELRGVTIGAIDQTLSRIRRRV